MKSFVIAGDCWKGNAMWHDKIKARKGFGWNELKIIAPYDQSSHFHFAFLSFRQDNKIREELFKHVSNRERFFLAFTSINHISNLISRPRHQTAEKYLWALPQSCCSSLQDVANKTRFDFLLMLQHLAWLFLFCLDSTWCFFFHVPELCSNSLRWNIFFYYAANANNRETYRRENSFRRSTASGWRGPENSRAKQNWKSSNFRLLDGAKKWCKAGEEKSIMKSGSFPPPSSRGKGCGMIAVKFTLHLFIVKERNQTAVWGNHPKCWHSIF